MQTCLAEREVREGGNTMVEWLLAKKDEIILFVTSSTFVGFVTSIFMILKQKKANKKNSEINAQLKSSLEEVNMLASDVKAIKEVNQVVTRIKTDVEGVKQNVTETLDLLTQKINAMLEVQSLVYSTVKDEKIRNNIAGIIADAKYADATARAALEKEIDNLKTALNSKVEVIKNAVNDTTAKVKKVVSENKTVIPRY